MLLDEIIKEIDTVRYDISGKKLTGKMKAALSRTYKKQLSDKNIYHSYSITNNIVEKIIIAEKKSCIWRGNHISISTLILKQNNDNGYIIDDELKMIREFFKVKVPLFVSLFHLDKRLIKSLKKSNFIEKSYDLIGKVEDGYLKVSKSKLPDKYTLQPMSFKKDIGEVQKFEEIAHQKDFSSIFSINGMDKKQKEKMKNYYKKWCSGSTAYTVMKSGKIVAAIGFEANSKVRFGFIGSIWVHPKHQGLGISKSLYKLALKEMLDQKCISYTGHTSTQKVLNSAKKMKRTVMTYHLISK